jgi:SAM-dependent methyltransferase
MKTKLWTEDSHRVLETATNLPRYNKWLVSLFAKHFGTDVLEIGSGLGGLSLLLPQESNITLSDTRDDYFVYLKKKFLKIVIKLDIEKNIPRSLAGGFDTIFASNVFEHIKDDQAAITNSYSLLKKGGKLLLFVPARPEIYGGLDSDMGHYRRYTKKELVTKAENAGFKNIDCFYANFPGYFLWWGRGKLIGDKIKDQSKSSKMDYVLSKFVDLIIVPFIYLEKLIPPPFGQSLVLIAQKVN